MKMGHARLSLTDCRRMAREFERLLATRPVAALQGLASEPKPMVSIAPTMPRAESPDSSAAPIPFSSRALPMATVALTDFDRKVRGFKAQDLNFRQISNRLQCDASLVADSLRKQGLL